MERNNNICKSFIIHEDRVNIVKQNMPEEELLHDMADFFKVFGDTTRIKILFALLFSEICVCDLSVLLQMNQSAISHQLRVLKQARLVKHRREGKVVYYSLKDRHVENIFEQGFIHLKEERPSFENQVNTKNPVKSNHDTREYHEHRDLHEYRTNNNQSQAHNPRKPRKENT